MSRDQKIAHPTGGQCAVPSDIEENVDRRGSLSDHERGASV